MTATVRTWTMRTAAAAILVAAVAIAFAGAGRRGTADWASLRAVIFESDDWGLAGFVPDATAWEGIDRSVLSPGRFPDVYWGSTLEDSVCVARLAALLAAHHGRDGLPAVLQPNYVLSALHLDGDRWLRVDLPAQPPLYERPGMWPAVQRAVRAGVWYPEFHATWHYDPRLRRERTLADPAVAAAARRGIMLFPGSERSWELAPWRPREELAAELDGSLARFADLFGRAPGSIIAPDYTWNSRIERLWQERGLDVIQAKREQRNPELGTGPVGRIRKYAGRQWARLAHPGRTYLERNCRFEPVQAPRIDEVVATCLDEVSAAWRRGEPAVVETHRVNFAHTDPAVAAAGTEAFAALLAGLSALDEAGDGPVYLTDHEVAQLQRRGTSWCVRGGRVVVRNGTRGQRIVSVPAAALRLAAAQAGRPGGGGKPLTISMPPLGVRELVPGQHFGMTASHR